MPLRLLVLTLLASSTVLSSGCTTAYRQSLGGANARVFNRIYLTDFNTAWQSVLDSLKHARLDVSNREAGFIQTRWTDNTAEKNFVDSFGTQDSYLKAQYRFTVNVAKGGAYNGIPSIKVSVQKEQIIQRDVLEGWKAIDTDEIDEKTLLYRIGRIIFMRMKLAKIEEEKVKKALKETKF
jgi:hypothetical protein